MNLEVAMEVDHKEEAADLHKISKLTISLTIAISLLAGC